MCRYLTINYAACNHDHTSLVSECLCATENPEGATIQHETETRIEFCPSCVEEQRHEQETLDRRISERLEHCNERARVLQEFWDGTRAQPFTVDDVQSLYLEKWYTGERIHPFFKSPFAHKTVFDWHINRRFFRVRWQLLNGYAYSPNVEQRRRCAWRLAWIDEMLQRQDEIRRMNRDVLLNDKQYDWRCIVNPAFPDFMPRGWPVKYTDEEFGLRSQVPGGINENKDLPESYWAEFEHWEMRILQLEIDVRCLPTVKNPAGLPLKPELVSIVNDTRQREEQDPTIFANWEVYANLF